MAATATTSMKIALLMNSQSKKKEGKNFTTVQSKMKPAYNSQSSWAQLE